jgi:hypothetical protein
MMLAARMVVTARPLALRRCLSANRWGCDRRPSAARYFFGTGARHRKCCGALLGCFGGTTQKPPMPCLEVSHAAHISGCHGTKVCKGVGVWRARSRR